MTTTDSACREEWIQRAMVLVTTSAGVLDPARFPGLLANERRDVRSSE